MTRRPIIRVIVFLLLGAIINVAVAWACAARSSLAQRPVVACQLPSGDFPHWYLVHRAGGIGVKRNEISTIHERVNTVNKGFVTLSARHWRRSVSIRTSATPHWSRAGEYLAKYEGSDCLIVIMSEQVSGWPMHVMWCSIFEKVFCPGNRNWIDMPDTRSAIVVGDARMTDLLSARRLPLVPIWPGFAINTIFYAAVLWLLFAAPGFVRRRIRRFRGRCLHCGYDLRGRPADSNKCPECGRSAIRTLPDA